MWILYTALGSVAALALILAVNTLRLRQRPSEALPCDGFGLDENALAERLAGMIRIETVTAADERDMAADELLEFHRYLERTYPLVHSALERETVSKYSLLYRWKGTQSGKKPILLAAHIDVVAVDESTLDKWKYPPFSGEIADGYVWGRGTLDCKGQLANILEAAEYLLAQGFKPERDIYLAFGHDEESMGEHGAQNMAKLLAERGVRAEFVLDEGGSPADGRILGVDALVAAVGIAEKRCMYLRLTARSKGGHAAYPPKKTAVGDIARAIAALEKHPPKPMFHETMRYRLAALSGYMKFPGNVLFSNLWLTSPLLPKLFALSPVGAAMVRTTMAVTLLKGSHAMNALAENAEAVVNIRLMPGQSVEQAIERVRKIAGRRVEVELLKAHSPCRVSSVQSDAYALIARTIGQIYGGCVMMPHLCTAATDSRWYDKIADDIYRFEPHRSLIEDGSTLHAAGERIRFDSIVEGTEFFIRLIQNA